MEYFLIDLVLSEGRLPGALVYGVVGGVAGGAGSLLGSAIEKFTKKPVNYAAFALIPGMVACVGLNHLKPWLAEKYPERAFFIENKIIAQNYSAALPQRLDDVTTLINVNGTQSGINYTYILDISASEISDLSVLTHDMRQNVTQKSCNTPDVRSLLEERNLSFTYLDSQAENIFAFEISKADC